MKSDLDTIREQIIGEVRHRIVRRRRDGTYWTTREQRSVDPNKFFPLEVPGQSGKQIDAERMFACNTGN